MTTNSNSKIKAGTPRYTLIWMISVILPTHHAAKGQYCDVQVTLWRERVILNHFTKWCYGLCVCPPVLEPNVLRNNDFTVRGAKCPGGRVVLSVCLVDQRFRQEDAEAHVVARDAAVHTKVATNVDVIYK